MDYKDNDMKSKRKQGALWVPFKVFWLEKMYFIWPLFILIFGLVNLWGGFIRCSSGEVDEALSGGVLYTFSISVCATLIADLIIDIVVNKRAKRELCFLTYRLSTAAFSIVWIIVLAFAWTGKLRCSVIFQIIFGLFSLILSCYMYGIIKMESHKEKFMSYDDQEYDYLEKENAIVQDNIVKQKDLKETPGGVAL